LETIACTSHLREDDEGSRVVVDEVGPEERSELAVPEEPAERELAELLADDPRVDAGLAVEPGAAPEAVEVEAERGRLPRVRGLELVRARGEVLPRRVGVAHEEAERRAR